MATWIVTGSNRGIGLEICRQLRARGDTVFAACRGRSKELDALDCHVMDGIDVTDGRSGSAIMAALPADAVVDVLLHNAGIMVRDQLASLDFETMRRQYEVNTIGPLQLTQALLPRLKAGSKIALVSSRAGSIGDGPSGGLYGYRASKAALNMVGVNMAKDLAPKGIFVTILHPGFIRTELTRGAGNDDPPVAATGLITRIDELDADRSGQFFHANGAELPW